MSEEFSKLSLKSKSIITSQTMTWTIPQSRLNQQCPFLEKEFPYFTTDFSFLHFSSIARKKSWKTKLFQKYTYTKNTRPFLSISDTFWEQITFQ